MSDDVKKVVEATKVIAEVCKKYHHFDKDKHDMICHEDCPFKYKDSNSPYFSCRIANYPFDYETELWEEVQDED